MKAVSLVFLVILVIVLGPMLTVWAVNTIAEQSGSDFYLHHNIWSYLAVIVLAGVVGGSSGKGK